MVFQPPDSEERWKSRTRKKPSDSRSSRKQEKKKTRAVLINRPERRGEGRDVSFKVYVVKESNGTHIKRSGNQTGKKGPEGGRGLDVQVLGWV